MMMCCRKIASIIMLSSSSCRLLSFFFFPFSQLPYGRSRYDSQHSRKTGKNKSNLRYRNLTLSLNQIDGIIVEMFGICGVIE